MSREEIVHLIELAIEERIAQLQDELQQRATFEDDDDFEKNTNINTIPKLKVVK